MENKFKADRVFSHYKILSEIGKGGMGEVYLAQDTELDRKVAIKFLSEELNKDSDKVNRFVQEAKAASALNHPNILTVYEIGSWEGTRYISTEFIEGETLRGIIRRKDPVPLNRILKIAIQVAEALSAAHDAGIAHRDIKPENIMVRKDGYVKVLDFGLAKLVERQMSEDGISLEVETKALVKTSPGMVMGTVSYMSPEQSRGKETDARTDIWSLGVVLYEMLSGRLPFSGETVNHTIVAILETEPKLLENIPDELQRIVRKTLTKDKEMRYQTARDLLIDLKNLRRDLDIQGELERSIVPNRELTSQAPENETQIYTERSFEATKSQSGAVVTHASSLEYAVSQAKTHKLATAIVALVLVSIVSAIAYFGFIAKSGQQIESIAVMPFENRSGNTDVEYLSDGMTETLIKSLSEIKNLTVKPRSSVFRYKGKDTDLQTIGKELNVEAILNGRVIQRGDQLTLSLELVDVKNDKVLWTESYRRKQSDIVTLQIEIAKDVSTKLKSKLSGADEAKVTKTSTANPEAYQLYLKGRFAWNIRTIDSLKQAAEYYQQAIEKDPSYALAYSGLAETYVLFPIWNIALPKDSLPRARSAALKALELDDSLAAPHCAIGQYLIYYEADRTGGEREFRRAIELDPDYATAHQWLGSEALLPVKRFDEAIAELKRAQELDPLSPIIGTRLADALAFQGRYEEAIAQYERTLSLNQNFAYAHQQLGWVYGLKGMYPEAIAEVRRATELNPDPTWKGYLAMWLARSGDHSETRKMLDELKQASTERYVQSYAIALVYIGLDEKENALTWLEKEVSDHAFNANYYLVWPELDHLRSEPRFKAMLKRMNLPE